MYLIDTPIFGFSITIIAFLIGIYVSRKVQLTILSPLIIAMLIIILLLLTFGIDYDIYNKGGSIISFFLGPATVVLAVPLFKQLNKLKSSGFPVIVGILVGTVTSICSIVFLSKALGLTDIITISLMPKSATTAISQEVSAMIGGIPALTIAATSITGISGNIMGPYLCKIFRINDEVAVGVSLGTISHVVGTAKAMEMGETQGAMGTLAIGVAGLATVFLAPLLAKLLF